MARQRQRERADERFTRPDRADGEAPAEGPAEGPAERDARSDAATDDGQGRRFERRVVRSEDPSLTPEANRLLTEEARAVLGRDVVEVPAGAPHHSDERHGRHSSWGASLASNRPVIYVTLAAAIVVGGIIALATGWWWVLVAAVGLHALATLLIVGGVIELTTQTEHAAPEVAARLEAEGVADPDRVLTEIVEDFAGAETARGVPEVLGAGHNELSDALDQPAEAALQQRTAMTPSAHAGEESGSAGGVEAGIPWWSVLASAVASLVTGAIIGGQGWVLPAIVVPVALGWVALQAWMARGAGSSADPDRAPGETAGAWSRLAPIGMFSVAAVVWFMIVMGWLISN